jgi:hypothetical protein
MTEPLEPFLESLRSRRGVHFSDPADADRLAEMTAAIREQLSLQMPETYLQFLRITDGIETQRGGLYGTGSLLEENVDIWLMDQSFGKSESGDFMVNYEPKPDPPAATYVHLAYNSGIGEYRYQTSNDRFVEDDTGDRSRQPLNADRSLVGLLRHMILR